MIFCDYLTFVVPARHRVLDAGRVLSIDADGSKEWEVRKRLQVKGSHESTLSLKTIEVDPQDSSIGTMLQVDGNPLKYCQGHNLFGLGTPLELAIAVLERLWDFGIIDPTPEDRDAWYSGAFRVSRVDLTAMFQTGSRANARTCVQRAGHGSNTRHGRPILKDTTCTWGMGSRRWSLVWYVKADEIEAKGHELPEAFQLPVLREWVEDKLRVEVRLRQLELVKLGCAAASDWSKEDRMSEIFRAYLGKITMAEQITLSPKKLEGVPPRLQLVYDAWAGGRDLRHTLPGRTFRRYRRELLAHGIDIANPEPQKNAPAANVVPLVRIIEARPARIPAEAFRVPGLVWEPGRKLSA